MDLQHSSRNSILLLNGADPHPRSIQIPATEQDDAEADMLTSPDDPPPEEPLRQPTSEQSTRQPTSDQSFRQPKPEQSTRQPTPEPSIHPNMTITQEGSSSANADADSGEPSSSNTARVTILVHGNPVDITDTGIDVTFLEALPDDMREEIINQHFREHRSTTQQERPEESQISPVHLEALLPDIRAE
ncbi:hypothetical protein M407DRAFT_218267, partial [Tulasnella calospora MUT 4182]